MQKRIGVFQDVIDVLKAFSIVNADYTITKKNEMDCSYWLVEFDSEDLNKLVPTSPISLQQ